MRIGIVSDTHGNRLMVNLALADLRERGITTILHCGDIDDPETVALFRGFTTHFVFGNCDIDQAALRAAMADIGATLHDHFGSIELEGVKLAFTHGDNQVLLRDVERLRLLRFFVLRPHAPGRGTPQRRDAGHQSRSAAPSEAQDVSRAGSGQPRGGVGRGRVKRSRPMLVPTSQVHCEADAG